MVIKIPETPTLRRFFSSPSANSQNPKETAADEKARRNDTRQRLFNYTSLAMNASFNLARELTLVSLTLHTAQPVSKLRKQPQNCGNLPI